MIEVLHAGIYISVQDMGRFGFAKIGVPSSGSMDSYATELGNILLENDKNAAVLEVTFGQGKFQFNKSTYICLTGADFSAELATKSIELNSVYAVEKGAILSFGKRKYGVRTYIAVQGGIQSEIILGSRSFSLGITKQQLKKGDKLAIKTKYNFDSKRFSKIKVQEKYYTSPTLKCKPGPEFNQLNKEQQEKLLEKFTISDNNNRVGIRLVEKLENNLKPILTAAVFPGTVQLTPSGKLIILMRDCQVTGGYPRILQLLSSSIDKLAQKTTNDIVKFKIIL